MSIKLSSCPYLRDDSVNLGGSSDIDLGTLTLADRYRWTTDNAGSPGHSVTGPNLYLTDLTNNRIRLIERSLGQLSVFLQDESLANSGSVSHALQLHFASTGVNQTGSGFGTGIQVFLTDNLDVMSEAGNIQVVFANPASHTSYVDIVARLSGAAALCGRFQWDGSIVAANTAGGQFLAPYLAASVNYGQFSAADVSTAFDGASANRFAGGAGGTLFAGNMSSSFTGRGIDIQRAGVSLFRMSGTNGQVVCTLSDTTNNAPTSPLVLDHVLTSGSPTTNFGTLLTMRTRDSAATAVAGLQLKCEATSVTPGAVTSQLTLQKITSGSIVNSIIVDANNKTLIQGSFGVGNRVAKTTLAAPGTVTGSIEVFDASGSSLGSIPVFANGSFS